MESHPSSLHRRLVLYGLLAHISLLAAAALAYPGGSWWDRHQRGFHIAYNFWCDLLRPVSHSGAPNPLGSLCARGALLTLALTLALFWPLVARQYQLSRSSRRLMIGAGWLGSLALVNVAVAIGNAQPLHDWSIILLGPPGLAVLVWSVALGIRRGSGLVRLLGIGAVVFSIWNMVQYFRQLVLHSEGWMGLPVVQRTATAFVLAWIAAVAQSSAGEARQSHGPRPPPH